jgi:hypothetical protein
LLTICRDVVPGEECLANMPDLISLDGGLTRCVRAVGLRGQLEAPDA